MMTRLSHYRFMVRAFRTGYHLLSAALHCRSGGLRERPAVKGHEGRTPFVALIFLISAEQIR